MSWSFNSTNGVVTFTQEQPTVTRWGRLVNRIRSRREPRPPKIDSITITPVVSNRFQIDIAVSLNNFFSVFENVRHIITAIGGMPTTPYNILRIAPTRKENLQALLEHVHVSQTMIENAFVFLDQEIQRQVSLFDYEIQRQEELLYSNTMREVWFDGVHMEILNTSIMLTWPMPNRPRRGHVQPLTESSMEPLSVIQQELLAKLKIRYSTVLQQQGGVNEVIQRLHKHVINLYVAQPMRYKIGDKVLDLPLEWVDLQNILSALTQPEQDHILKLYYKNTMHTAYRYFLKPNPWISPESRWAGGELGSLRWANFDQYTEEIAYLWLAASDPIEATTDKMSVTERQLFFIGHIALTERSHNIDSIDHHNRDNLLADDPACHMGVLTRMLAGLREHSLLTVSVDDAAKLQISVAYQEYYKEILQQLTDEYFEKIIAGEFVEDLNKKPTSDQIDAYLLTIEAQLQFSQYDAAFVLKVIDKIRTQLNEHPVVITQDPTELHFNRYFIQYGLDKVYKDEAERREKLATRSRPRLNF